MSLGLATDLLHKHVWSNYGHSEVGHRKGLRTMRTVQEEETACPDVRTEAAAPAWFHFKRSGRGSWPAKLLRQV